MGLDIYFHKYQKEDLVERNAQATYQELEKRTDQEKIAKSIQIIMDYRLAHPEQAHEAQLRALQPLLAPYSFPAKWNNPNKWSEYSWEEVYKAIQDTTCTYEGHFSGTRWLANHFFARIEDNYAFASKMDMESLLYKCQTVLKDHSRAPELLPDTYRSDSYDETYFTEVEITAEVLEKLYKADPDAEYVIYFSY